MKDANDILRASGPDELRRRFDSALVNGREPLPVLPNGAAKPTISAEIIRVSSVQAQPIKWLWPSRMALGKVTMVAGNPGLGKSQFTTYLAAQVSSGGNWAAKEGKCPHGSVLMLSAEDDVADTIRPRLEVAGANIHRVLVLTAIKEATATRGFNLARDLQQLEKALTDIGDVKLIIIDPITAYLGATDSHKTADVRALLAPVSDLAARHGVAIVAISHLNKGGGSEAMGRITGSVAFVAAARGAYLIQKDPEDSTRRLFLPIKNNLGVDDAGLAFRIVERETDGGIRAPAIEWEDGRVTMSADEALASASANEGEEGNALCEAVEFLEKILAGGPVPQKTINADARGNGISDRTLKRAKSKLRVLARKTGMDGGWTWELPAVEGGQVIACLAPFEEGHQNPKEARQNGVAPFEVSGPLRAECRAPEPEQPLAQNTGVTVPGEDSATNVPAPYVQPFKALQSACPAEVPRERWRRCLDDAGPFLKRWGQHAQRLGWSPQDLMGLHPTAPLAPPCPNGTALGSPGANSD
jgi:putative DNA primase/helicase